MPRYSRGKDGIFTRVWTPKGGNHYFSVIQNLPRPEPHVILVVSVVIRENGDSTQTIRCNWR